MTNPTAAKPPGGRIAKLNPRRAAPSRGDDSGWCTRHPLSPPSSPASTWRRSSSPSARGELARPDREDAQAELIRRKGDEHERAYLDELRGRGLDIAEIELRRDWERAAAETADALARGVDVVYQGVFVHDGWRGIADFLERQPDGSYEAADTKLARTSKPAHILQLCFYTEQLARLTGREPAFMHVVLGSGLRDSYRPGDFMAYYRRVRQRFLEFVADPPETYPLPVSHCQICDFRERCTAQWERDDHLTLVARLGRNQVPRLNDAGIATLAQLATAPPDTEVPRMTQSTFEALHEQAALQYAARTTGRHSYRLLEPEPKRGFELLPKPSPGDVFFDIEGDPFWAPDRGLEYLFGVLWREDGGTRFRAFWAHDRESEKRAFEQLVDFLHERLRADPAMHVYHYAFYEPAVLKRLMGLYGTREEEVDDLLRREVLVDLFAVVRHALRASYPSYSLKDIERFYLDGREAEVKGGADSVLLYEQWRESGGDELLEAIRAYNEEDCLSTLLLRDWLLERRAEAESQYGRELAWFEPEPPRELKRGGGRGARRAGAAARRAARRPPGRPERAHRGRAAALPRRAPARVPPARGEARLVGVLRPARQEPGRARPRRRGDRRARARGLGAGAAGALARARVHVPRAGAQARGRRRGLRSRDREEGRRDPRARRPAPAARARADPRGRAAAARAHPRRAVRHEAPARGARAPRARDAIATRRSRASCGASGRGPGARSLQTTDLDEMKRLVLDLDRSHLVVQGPPGSGKTWTGARLIVHLLARGQARRRHRDEPQGDPQPALRGRARGRERRASTSRG